MSKSVHQFEIKGVDKSAGAFRSIKGRAAATGAQIKSIVGGALQFAGVYMGFQAIKDGINELGHLSDVAQRTSTSVGELTKMAAAMGALGVNMGPDQIATAFDRMAKSTGRTGMAGFYQTIEEIGKMPDVSARADAAMKVFGRAGMEFIPLINGAEQSVDALKQVVSAMPEIPQSAADAGDAVSDAMGFAAAQVKSIWLQGIGIVCGWFDKQFAGGVREAALAACNYLEYYAKVGATKAIGWFNRISQYLTRFGEYWGTFVGTLAGGGSLKDAFIESENAWQQNTSEYSDTLKEIEAWEKEHTDRFRRNFEDRKIAISKFQKAYDKAAVSTAKSQAKINKSIEATVSSKSIRNDLVYGGTNQLLKMQVFGPSYQSEQKKQTDLLSKIAANTEKTADNTEAGVADQLGVID